jgi:hypothetical protein
MTVKMKNVVPSSRFWHRAVSHVVIRISEHTATVYSEDESAGSSETLLTTQQTTMRHTEKTTMKIPFFMGMSNSVSWCEGSPHIEGCWEQSPEEDTWMQGTGTNMRIGNITWGGESWSVGPSGSAYWLGYGRGWTIGDSLPGALHQRIQTGPGAQRESYPLGAHSSFLRNKAAGAWSWSLISISSEVK